MFQLKRKLFVFGLATLLAVIAVSARAQTFSLEQVMSSPFPSELTVSKRGDKVAWAFDAEGKRNIWIAEAPAFNARQLTHYNNDDGQELTDLVFSPNGNTIAYVRGGDANQAGEVPNPSSDPSGAKQEVWVVDVRTGRNAGLWTVGVTYGFATHTLEDEPPDVLVEEPREVGAVFSG